MIKRIQLLFFILISSISVLNCKNKQSNIYVFKEVGWRIKVPADLIVDSPYTQKDLISTKKTFQKYTSQDLANDKEINFIKIKTDRFNILSSSIALFDNKNQINWKQNKYYLFLLSLQTLKNESPSQTTIDTSRSMTMIDHVEFMKFHTHIHFPNGTHMNTFWFTTLYKGYDFSIYFSYTDAAVGLKFSEIIDNSTFD